MKVGFIYIMTNKNNTNLYTGITSNLPLRIQEHKDQLHPYSFTARYNLYKLVYWEAFQDIGDAIFREKQIKAESRQKKISFNQFLKSGMERFNGKYQRYHESLLRLLLRFAPRNDKKCKSLLITKNWKFSSI